MITPVSVLSVNDICERKSDLLVSAEDIKLIAKNTEEEVIRDFSHELKEAFNQEFPRDMDAKSPYLTLERAREMVDEVAEMLRGE